MWVIVWAGMLLFLTHLAFYAWVDTRGSVRLSAECGETPPAVGSGNMPLTP